MMNMLDKHLTVHPTEGVESMVLFLKNLGHPIGPKRVRRMFRLMDRQTLYRRRNLTKLGLKKFIKPYLLSGLEITRPNQVWCTDTSALWTQYQTNPLKSTGCVLI
jgi:putative transposase